MQSADSTWACHLAYIVGAIKLQSSILIALRMHSFRDPSNSCREDRRTEEMHLLTAGQLHGRLERKLLQCRITEYSGLQCFIHFS